MSINKVILIGNVGKDPEIRYLDGGTAVCNFSLATSETYTNKSGEKVTQTEWHNIVMWRKLAEITEKYVKKGSQIYIEGRLRTRSWEDKEGNKRYTTEILADNMKMLGRRPDSETANTNAPTTSTQESTAKQPEQNTNSEDKDDLPF